MAKKHTTLGLTPKEIQAEEIKFWEILEQEEVE